MNVRPKIDRRSIIASFAAASVAAATTYFAMKGSRSGTYIQLGTSITAGVAPSASITPRVVAQTLGMDGINGGFDGACAGRHKVSGIEHRSLYSLTDAITSGDWTAQRSETNENLKAHISQLITTDFSHHAILGLEYGTNDFNYCRPIGLASDETTETFQGALNHSVAKFVSAFPRLRLFLITPTWRLNFSDQDSDTHPNETGQYLREYVDAMIEVATRHHVPCLDLWRNLGLNVENYKAFTLDGLHPNKEGAMRRGQATAAFIKATF